MNTNDNKDTSWQSVAGWYNKKLSSGGSYYHEHVVIPGSVKLLNLMPGDSLLDLGCGNGHILSQLPSKVYYQGVDLAADLIKYAQENTFRPNTFFEHADITSPLNLNKTNFSHCSIVLALQNVKDPEAVIKNAAKHLTKDGKFLIVINHPYFRIPKFTSWEVDHRRKLQYRRVDAYLSSRKIPIDMNPGQEQEKSTWSFHHPLSSYTSMLKKNNFVITEIEEWISDKTSQGKAAEMENTARGEFPMFMAIMCEKR